LRPFCGFRTAATRRCRTTCEKARLRTLKDLDAAAIQLSQVGRLLLDRSVPDAAVRGAAFARVVPEALEAAVGQVERLVRPPEDVYYQELCESFRRVRTFLPSLLRTVRFGATPAAFSRYVVVG